MTFNIFHSSANPCKPQLQTLRFELNEVPVVRRKELDQMVTSITVNIAVGNLERSTRFLERLGFEVDPMFAAEPDMELIKLSSTIYVMLNSGPRFESISRKKLVDTSTHAEAVVQLRVDTRSRVDEIVDAALSEGCSPIHPPNDDGPIYGRSFQDLDGHNWDCFCIDVEP